MKHALAPAAATLLAASLVAASARAASGWTGDTIHALDVYDGYVQSDDTVDLPGASSIQVLAWQDYGTFTVPGSANGVSLSFDMTSDQIMILAAPGDPTTVTTQWLPVSQNGYDFFDTSNNPGITGVTLDASSTAAGASNATSSSTPIRWSSTSPARTGTGGPKPSTT